MRSTTQAAPLVLAVQRELLERGAWPLLRTELPGQAEGWWAAAREEHLDAFAPAELAEADAIDALLAIQAPENTTALAGVDPARMARAARARAPVREASLRRRWCGTLWPTPAGAQQAGMGTAAFADFVRRATFLDRDDPAAAWASLREVQARLIERLSRARELRIEAEGTDLHAARRRAHVGELRRAAQHAVGRGLHRAARGLRRGADPLHDPLQPAWRRGRGDRARVPRGPGRLRARRPRRGLPAGHARHRPGRARARRAGDRHEPGHRPPDRRDPLRREDRRHRAPGRSAAPTRRPAARTTAPSTGT